MIIRCVDLETCGLTPADGGIVEVGWSDVIIDDNNIAIDTPISRLCNPGCPIPPTASAVHHWVDFDVYDKPPSSEVFIELMDGADVFCAHNAKFERQFIETEKPFICTYKVAVHHASQAPDHSLQVLRYWLKLVINPSFVMLPHRADSDSYVCAALLARMLAKISIEEMIEISSRPALLPKLRFGEHANKPLAEVPKSYLEWILKKGTFDEDVKYTANHYLKL